MSHLIKVASRKEFASKDLWEMHRLRAKVFKDRMGWEVPIISDMEIDGYDALEPHYLMAREHERGLRGCMRVLPTVGPYMLKNTFPELLYGHSAPESPKIWELSRFAVEAEDQQGFGFSELTMEVTREIVRFGDKMGIERYATVTTPSIERMMRHAGLAVTRYGPPIQIGVEKAVALDFDIGEQTHEALFGRILKAA